MSADLLLAVGGALIVGGTLGLLGSGGSILTVPILVYLLGRDAEVAIPESLAIVGVIALSAALPHAVAGRVRWGAFLSFAVGGTLGAFGGAKLAALVPGELQLVVFAVVMATAAWRMLRPKPTATVDAAPPPLPLLALTGLGVGVLTGFVGVGGGFLIVPALVLIARLPMREAVATSLALIVVNCAGGLTGYGLAGIDWATVAVFGVVGFVGGQIGGRVGARLPQATLKRAFAIFLIPMACLILVRELMELAG